MKALNFKIIDYFEKNKIDIDLYYPLYNKKNKTNKEENKKFKIKESNYKTN